MDFNIINFWFNVNFLIKSQNKTQRSLALECGFTERRIENLSSNNRSPDVIEAVKIAKALNTTVEYLVTGEKYELSEIEKKKLKDELIQTLENSLGI